MESAQPIKMCCSTRPRPLRLGGGRGRFFRDVREDVEAQPVVHKLFDRFPYPAVSGATYRSPCCGILIGMMPLILIGSLLLVVLGILIVLGVIPIFPEKKRERRPARKVAAPRN
jgi:hypothetical protein